MKLRGFASFLFQTKQVYPEQDQFVGPSGSEKPKMGGSQTSES